MWTFCCCSQNASEGNLAHMIPNKGVIFLNSDHKSDNNTWQTSVWLLSWPIKKSYSLSIKEENTHIKVNKQTQNSAQAPKTQPEIALVWLCTQQSYTVITRPWHIQPFHPSFQTSTSFSHKYRIINLQTGPLWKLQGNANMVKTWKKWSILNRLIMQDPKTQILVHWNIPDCFSARSSSARDKVLVIIFNFLFTSYKSKTINQASRASYIIGIIRGTSYPISLYAKKPKTTKKNLHTAKLPFYPEMTWYWLFITLR